MDLVWVASLCPQVSPEVKGYCCLKMGGCALIDTACFHAQLPRNPGELRGLL